MKKLIFVFGCVVITIQSFSQSDISFALGHQRIAGRFVGWSPAPPGSVAGSLDIRNDFVGPGQPIDFWTNLTRRMRILADGRITVNAVAPLILGTALDAQVTINSGNAEGVFGTTSGGARPRIYFETRNPLTTIDQAMCHSVPTGFLPVVSTATSGILWNNIVFGAAPRSDFNINTRTATFGAMNALTVEQFFGRVGINNPAAANRLEITSLLGDPFFGTTNGSSGVRLTNMKSTDTPIANPGQGVLSVDANGDVRYVFGSIGNLCFATTTNPLAGHYEIPMNNFNFHFTDNGSGALFNNVGIGTACGALTSRLEVVNPVMDFGVTSTTTSAVGNNFGVRGFASNAGVTSTGIAGYATSLGSFNTTGVYGEANNAAFTSVAGDFFSTGVASVNNIGVRGRANGSGTLVQGVFGTSNATASAASSRGGDFVAFGSTTENAAVVGNVSSPGLNNYGGVFRAVGGTNNYAVYAQVALPFGFPGYDPGLGAPGKYAGYFLGDVFIAGSYGPSDVNMKENISSITNADSIINLLDPIYFDFKQSGQWGWLGLPQNKQSGLRAQDVEPIIPSFVKDNVFPTQYDSTGAVIQASFTFKTIDYDKFIPLLLSSNKNLNAKVDEQETTIEALEERLTTLENCINGLNLCETPSMIAPNNNSNSGDTKSKDVELKDAQSLILNQNVPNPFAEMTTITYSLNDGIQKAQMLFYNSTGMLINSMDLQPTSGKGQLNVFANDLSNGMYTYTLVVDGKIIDTKRMVKNK